MPIVTTHWHNVGDGVSYCRFGTNSHVYVAGSLFGGIDCLACILHSEGMTATFQTRTEMIAHLEEHRNAGHSVEEHPFNRLREEIEEYGDLMEYNKGNPA
ncbi:hypothetical protein LCGC14_0642060 [marine sediment metagenome]|uniref:Uncharacterized protein n=1 Tax=marine sediment metagenome TaxID=412755 RepID=A0A0F9R3Y6_9ZZZZ